MAKQSELKRYYCESVASFEGRNITIEPYEDIEVYLADEADKVIADLEQKIAWVEERRNARPEHPEDERPWCADYLDAKQQLKEKDEEIARFERKVRMYDVLYAILNLDMSDPMSTRILLDIWQKVDGAQRATEALSKEGDDG